MKRFAIFAVAVCSLALWSVAANASLINVDFANAGATYTYTGAAVAGATTDVWNAVNAAGSKSLVDSTGATTTVSLSMDAYTGARIYTGAAFWSTPVYMLMGDFSTSYTGTAGNTVSLSGIAAGTYDLYVYSASNDVNRASTFTATTSAGGLSVTIGPNPNANVQGSGTFISGVTYGKVANITVGANGLLSLSSTSATGEIDLNAIQLQSVAAAPVPEPTTMALLASGVLGLLAYAWRKRK